LINSKVIAVESQADRNKSSHKSIENEIGTKDTKKIRKLFDWLFFIEFRNDFFEKKYTCEYDHTK
jgi:hypothetical protein